nr:GDP-fucose protein O-fucosyltransferase [Tanacetum cinerariifolium]
MSRPVEGKHTPLHVSPQWNQSRYLKKMRREGVLLLRGLESRLTKDLPSDLKKLRCKVAFHALRGENRVSSRVELEIRSIIYNERKSRPELLTSRSSMTYHDRKLAGLCALNAMEVNRKWQVSWNK